MRAYGYYTITLDIMSINVATEYWRPDNHVLHTFLDNTNQYLISSYGAAVAMHARPIRNISSFFFFLGHQADSQSCTSVAEHLLVQRSQ